MNPASYAVLGAVLLWAALCVWFLFRKRKTGTGCCSGICSGCSCACKKER